MSKRSVVSRLTINSLSSLLKVRSSHPIKTLLLFRNFSTAVQSSDFYVDGYPADNSSSNCQKPNGINSESQASVSFSENQSRNGLNSNWGFRETPGNGSGENPSLQIGNYEGVNGQNERNWQYNGNGSQGAYQQSNLAHASQNGAGENPSLQIGNYDGFNGQNERNWQYNGNGSQGAYWQSNLAYASQNGSYSGYNSYNSEVSLRGYHGGNWNVQNGGMNNYYTVDTGMYQHHPRIDQYSQNLNTGQYQQNLNSTSNHIAFEGESMEASGDRPNSGGTIEELDEFCKLGKVKEAIEVLHLLEVKHVSVNLDSLVRLMHACGEAQAVEEAKVVHDYITRSMTPLKVRMCNKILQMYGKCGAMDLAFDVFDKMSNRNLTSWDTMITWLAKNGLGEDAIDLFSRFKEAGLKPDAEIFLGVFSACAAVGDVNEGMLHFESMTKSYGIVPSVNNYVGVVAMLGSSGHLEEALEFVEKMPIDPSVEVWETMMTHSRLHGFMELGDRCAQLVERLDPSRLNGQSKAGLIPIKASDLQKEKEKKKLANLNLLEVRSRVHEYRAGDTSHPDNDRIYALLRGLRAQMKEAGYIPETKFVLHDIDQEGKEDALLAHSERLATAQGLLTTAARSPVRIIKNLRVCGDCHNAFKIISKLVGREIIMRDAKRFHHFRDGVCSCRDYW